MEVDCVLFSEPIGGCDRPLLSPEVYRDLVLASYAPIIAAARRSGVETTGHLRQYPRAGQCAFSGYTCYRRTLERLTTNGPTPRADLVANAATRLAVTASSGLESGLGLVRLNYM